MKTLWTFASLLTLASTGLGCTPPRALIQPTLVADSDRRYIYIVEQEAMASSRLQKCDIAADNGVTCKTQYDLKP